MNKPFISFLCLLLFLTNPLTAGDSFTILKGRKIDYAGDSLVFLSYSNMISFHEERVGVCAVDDSGFFECRIKLSQTKHIFIYLGVYNCYLYAQPDLVYNIQLPGRRDKSLQDLVNPYFEETAIHLSAKVESTTNNEDVSDLEKELNFTIRAFNDAFYPYYYKYAINAYGKRVDRGELDKAELEIKAPFDSMSHPFLVSYIEYRMGLLQHYGGQKSNKRIFGEYFEKKPVLHYNPAYMELFNQLNKNFFLAFAEENPGPKLPIVLNREKDYRKVNEILIKEASLKNDSLRELVLLKGLYDGIFDEKNIPSSMIQLLDSLQYHTQIDIHKQAVKDIMLEITEILPGYKPPDFTLYNADSTLISLSDLQGNYVYLNFCNSFGYYCIREFEYLKVIHERLKDRLKIVTILVDDSVESMEELVKSNNYPWTFLHFSNQPDVMESYDIRAYPSYFLIGPDGTLILSPAPSPVENFEPTFNRIYLDQ
ncbi:MAG TPA: redoxin domain-containing protein [Bacteroides sp.]|nr:redoxin domain-containing protein [Bacteroides sp.]